MNSRSAKGQAEEAETDSVQSTAPSTLESAIHDHSAFQTNTPQVECGSSDSSCLSADESGIEVHPPVPPPDTGSLPLQMLSGKSCPQKH